MLPKELLIELKLHPETIDAMEAYRKKMATEAEGFVRFFSEPLHDMQLIFSGLHLQNRKDHGKSVEVAKAAADVIALMIYHLAAQSLGHKPTPQNLSVVAGLLSAYLATVRHSAHEWMVHYATHGDVGEIRIMDIKEPNDVH